VTIQATLATLTDAVNSTTEEEPLGSPQAHHISKGTAMTLRIISAIPVVVIPVVTTRGGSPAPPGAAKSPCPPTAVVIGCG
jgi:hypothetical protein